MVTSFHPTNMFSSFVESLGVPFGPFVNKCFNRCMEIRNDLEPFNINFEIGRHLLQELFQLRVDLLSVCSVCYRQGSTTVLSCVTNPIKCIVCRVILTWSTSEIWVG